MPFSRPGLPDLISRTEGELSSRLAIGPLPKRSAVKVLARVLAGAAHLLYGFLDWIARQVMVDTAEKEHLDRWASIWGILRKSAEYASGSAAFAGNDGAVIPAGTVLQRADGVRFLTTSEAVVASGQATLSLEAELPGKAGNEDAGVAVTLVTPIVGVNSTGEILAGGLAGGTDEEDDETLRARLLMRLRETPHGGAAHDYEAWALEVPGVTRAWVRPGWLGVASVGVLFVRDGDSSSIFPSGAQVQEMQTYLEERRPVTAEVLALAPTPKALNPSIQVTPNTQAVRDAIAASLEALLTREAEPGSTLRLSRISEAVSIAAGESHHTLVSPVADVVSAQQELHVLGSITWV